MKIRILLPGKTKPKALAPAEEEYIRRLGRFGVEVMEYKDEKVSSRSPEQSKDTEAQRVFRLLKEGDYLVVCDERGDSLRTHALADFIKASRSGTQPLAGKRRVVILIGGALGLADALRDRADAVWSLSALVMAGGVARLVLLEALYRAFTVVEGHPYHNE